MIERLRLAPNRVDLLLEMDDLIRQHAAIMDKQDPEKRVGLIIDEWGAWHAVEPGSYGALALGLGHFLVKEKLYDAAFTHGFREGEKP